MTDKQLEKRPEKQLPLCVVRRIVFVVTWYLVGDWLYSEVGEEHGSVGSSLDWTKELEVIIFVFSFFFLFYFFFFYCSLSPE